MKAEARVEPNWRTVRVAFFWFGAACTAVVGLVLLSLIGFRSSDTLTWYGINIVAGPSIAYSVAWLGHRWLSVHVIASMLFVVALFFTFSPGISLFYLLGFLSILSGTPRRYR